MHLEELLGGGDLRSIGKSNEVVSLITSQQEFNTLFAFLFHQERLFVMRAADAIEKITLEHPEYLAAYHKELYHLCQKAVDKELKWHLALLVPRLALETASLRQFWIILKKWATDPKESRIVRVNAMQSLYELSEKDFNFPTEFSQLLAQVEKEKIPALQARIRKWMTKRG